MSGSSLALPIPAWQVSYNGVDITSKMDDLPVEISYEESTGKRACSVKLSLADTFKAMQSNPPSINSKITLAIGYSGISASVPEGPAVVSVSDISFLEVDGLGWARRGCLARAFGLLVRRVLVEQDDDTVFVPLVEQLGCIHHAITRGCANILVHSHFHLHTLTRAASRAPAIGPRSHR